MHQLNACIILIPAILMSIVSLFVVFVSSHTIVYPLILDTAVNDILDTRGISDICSTVNSSPIDVLQSCAKILLLHKIFPLFHSHLEAHSISIVIH